VVNFNAFNRIANKGLCIWRIYFDFCVVSCQCFAIVESLLAAKKLAVIQIISDQTTRLWV